MKYSFIKDNDWVLIITTFLLTGFGLIMVFSASYALGLEDGFGNNPYYFIQRQLVWFALALLAFLFFLCIFRYRFFSEAIAANYPRFDCRFASRFIGRCECKGGPTVD